MTKNCLNNDDIKMIFSVWMGSFDHRDPKQIEQSEKTFDKLCELRAEVLLAERKGA